MANRINHSDSIDVSQTVTIANSGTVSTELDCAGMNLVGFILPAAFTGTQLSLQGATASGGTYYDICDSSDSYNFTVTQGRAYIVQPADLAGWRYLKFKATSTQAGERTITAILRAL